MIYFDDRSKNKIFFKMDEYLFMFDMEKKQFQFEKNRQAPIGYIPYDSWDELRKLNRLSFVKEDLFIIIFR